MTPTAELLSHTPQPERTVALAARLCYSARGVAGLDAGFGEAEVASLLDKLLGMGHFSALEHAQFVFGIEGISRACSHQLVRHRIASFSQQSQRYVTLGEVKAVLPPAVSADPQKAARFQEKLEDIWAFYRELVEDGVAAEDARYILPNACETKLVVSMNARELRHFFRLRLCRRAQWEIRDLALAMLRAAAPAAPLLFRDAGPGCLAGACPEGAYSCGETAAVRADFANLTHPTHG